MNKVCIKTCKEYDLELLKQAISDIFNHLGGIENIIKENDKVFIKPNMLGPHSPDQAITTHPIFLKAVIQLVKTRTNNIIVGDNPAIKEIKTCMKVSGIGKVIEEESVLSLSKELISIENKDSKIFKSFEVSKDMVDANVFINLPKLKTHSLTYITCSIKNMFGLIYGLSKSNWHIRAKSPLEFSNLMADLYHTFITQYQNKKILSLVDGILGLQGEGPSTSGTPINSNIIIGGIDFSAVDVVACEIMQLDPSKNIIPLVIKERELGYANISEIDLVGDDINNVKIQFIPPKNSLSIFGLKVLRIKFLVNLLQEHPKILKTKCIKCQECVKICPAKTLKLNSNEKKLKLKKNKCIRCFCCIEVCPKNAIYRSRRPLLGKIVLKDRKS